MDRLVIVSTAQPRTTFAERMAPATVREKAAADAISEAGWTVGQFGQAMLTSDVRAALRKTDSDLRWLPDLVAARGHRECLIDAKTTLRTDTANHSIELRAHRAHLSVTFAYGSPVVYYFGDGSVTLAVDLKIECLMDGRWTAGSGTPFLLTRKANQGSFDATFGPEPAVDWTRDWRQEGRRALLELQKQIGLEFGDELGSQFWRSK